MLLLTQEGNVDHLEENTERLSEKRGVGTKRRGKAMIGPKKYDQPPGGGEGEDLSIGRRERVFLGKGYELSRQRKYLYERGGRNLPGGKPLFPKLEGAKKKRSPLEKEEQPDKEKVNREPPHGYGITREKTLLLLKRKPLNRILGMPK